MRGLEIRQLGTVPYADALAMQRELVEARRSRRVPDQLMLLEHPHVVTIGVRGSRSHVLAGSDRLSLLGVELHETGRGGDVTYHGPGQIVGYPVVDLRPDRCDVHRYVRDLEEVMIRTAQYYGLNAGRLEGLTGTWVDGKKIGAIGVRISRWITSHGFAFNVNTDLSYFDLIVPCGITGRGVTSLSHLLGRPLPLREVEEVIIRHFCDVFGCIILARRVPEDRSAI